MANATHPWRMPAEWEPHAATWLAWPHNAKDWPGKIIPIHHVYGEIVRKLASGENVHIIVNDAVHEDKAWRILANWSIDPTRVRFFRYPTNRGWTRDFGPICVVNSAPPDATHAPSPATHAVAKFGFNAWAKYKNWQLDNAAGERAAADLNFALHPITHAGNPVILEGGAIDVNGRGTLLTTEECLLDPKIQVRNPGFTQHDYAAVLSSALGASNIIWLGRGVAGDDTHGHVDDLARFVNPTTIVLAQESDEHDANFAPLRENFERLQSAKLEDGSQPEVIPLPMPRPLVFDGLRLPASYANFYIGNAAVLVPTFNDPADRIALGILADLFPGRAVVGIHAVDLVWGLGTLHCLTQQQPA